MSCEAPAVPKHTVFGSVLDVSEALVALTQLPCLCRTSHKLRLSHRCNFDHCAMFDSIGAVKFKSPPHQPVALRANWVMMAPGELQCPAVPGSSVCCPRAKEQQGSRMRRPSLKLEKEPWPPIPRKRNQVATHVPTKKELAKELIATFVTPSK